MKGEVEYKHYNRTIPVSPIQTISRPGSSSIYLLKYHMDRSKVVPKDDRIKRSIQSRPMFQRHPTFEHRCYQYDWDKYEIYIMAGHARMSEKQWRLVQRFGPGAVDGKH